MTTFIKAKLNKSDDQTNIDKYSVATNIIEYHSYYNKIFHFCKHYSKIHDKAIISRQKCM